MRISEEMMTPREKQTLARTEGFSLIELMVVAVVLLIVLGTVFNYIAATVQRSQAEQTKVDLTQEAREFVDEFERDVHQAGYPNCMMFNTASNCAAHFNDAKMAVGLVSVSNTQVIFEGDVDGDGIVDTVAYRLVDSAGNSPPTGTCPCTVQRSQLPKVNGTAPLAQPHDPYSQELQNLVNSGTEIAPGTYGGGLPIAGNTAFYAAFPNLQNFPVFTAFDQSGASVVLPADINATPLTLATIKSIRLTINLLGSATTGYDMKTGVRPVMTLVGNGRMNNLNSNF